MRPDGRNRIEETEGRQPHSSSIDDKGSGEIGQIDPERVLLLDTYFTNNSRTLTPARDAAATKWSLRWMVWLQDLFMTFAFLV